MILIDSSGVRESKRLPAKAKGGVWRLECKWCGLVMREGDEPCSHGICRPCMERELKAYLPPDLDAQEGE